MRQPGTDSQAYQRPALSQDARRLATYLKTLSPQQLGAHMQLSPHKAEQTYRLIQSWTDDAAQLRPAIDAFLGDIYSGLQVQSLTTDDRAYANGHLLILSGLYGGLRALDSIHPYRFEMGYKLPDTTYNPYSFWGDKIAALIPKSTTTIINLSAVEYTKAVLPYITLSVITPKFLTVSPKHGEPTFVTVHTKIARGAFASWMIRNRIDDIQALKSFNELGYTYDNEASTNSEPVFVCKEFKGLGLSVRLT